MDIFGAQFRIVGQHNIVAMSCTVEHYNDLDVRHNVEQAAHEAWAQDFPGEPIASASWQWMVRVEETL